MNYSDIKYIKDFCECEIDSEPRWREVITELVCGSKDFEVDGVRFIHCNDIDDILADELSSDLYMLGCFNDWFLADVLDLDVDVIQAMQEAQAFEALGKLIVSMNKLGELVDGYVSADGYGHHFNHYDGNEQELTIGVNDYYHVFDNR